MTPKQVIPLYLSLWLIYGIWLQFNKPKAIAKPDYAEASSIKGEESYDYLQDSIVARTNDGVQVAVVFELKISEEIPVSEWETIHSRNTEIIRNHCFNTPYYNFNPSLIKSKKELDEWEVKNSELTKELSRKILQVINVYESERYGKQPLNPEIKSLRFYGEAYTSISGKQIPQIPKDTTKKI